MAIDFSDFWTRFGKAAHSAKQFLQNTGPDQDTIVQGLVDAFDSEVLDIRQSVDGFITQFRTGQAQIRGLTQSLLIEPVQRLVVETVFQDTGIRMTLQDAVREIVRQMEAATETVDQSTVSVTVTAAGGNTGTGKGVATIADQDGRDQELVLDEDIVATVVEVSEAGATFEVRGERARGTWEAQYPAGSGLNYRMGTLRASSASNLIPGATLTDVEGNDATCPLGWLATDAQDTLSLTDIEVQTIAISGTPTTGWFSLKVLDNQGRAYVTKPLAVGASSADVEAAIRELPGFGQVTVETSGTSPNFTYTITYVGVPNPGTVSGITDFDTGSIGSGTVTYSSGEVAGEMVRSIKIDGNGSEQTTLHVPVSPPANTRLVFWALLKKATLSAGVLEVSLRDGVDGTVLVDESGTNCSGSVTLTSIGSGWYHFAVNMRTPKKLPAQTYLRLKCTTAIDASGFLYISGTFLGPMPVQYAGGPGLAIFDGDVRWALGDKITFAVSNDYDGQLQLWFDRFVGLRTIGVQLPTSGTPTYADTLIG